MSACTDDRLCRERQGDGAVTESEEERGHLQGEGFVLWELNEEDRSKVVTGQGCSLVV